jgi:hypothetical protein
LKGIAMNCASRLIRLAFLVFNAVCIQKYIHTYESLAI